jgi:hypothetical protein
VSQLLVAQRALTVPGWAKDALWRRAQAIPSLDLRFADSKSLVDATTGSNLVTFTRASSGTYIDSAGVLQTATTDVPRFDHNPTTGESLGLLVEEQRANLLLHNRTLTNAAWVVSNITPAKDQVGADGVSNSASSITATDANGTILQTITSASAARATSAYVKRITGTGTIEMTQNNGSTWTAVTVTSAWTRVTIPSATVTNPVVGFRIVTSGDAIAVDYAQLENGAFSTSAIETTTAAVTRSADVASITGSAFSSWYRQDEGTVFAEYSNQVTAGQDRRIFNTLDATSFTTNGSSLFLSNGAQAAASFNTFVGGSNIGVLHFAATPLVAGVFRKAAYSTQINSRVLVVGGAAPLISSNSYTPPSNIVTATLGQDGAGTSSINGAIRRLTYWNRRLPDSTLQTLTQ